MLTPTPPPLLYHRPTSSRYFYHIVDESSPRGSVMDLRRWLWLCSAAITGVNTADACWETLSRPQLHHLPPAPRKARFHYLFLFQEFLDPQTLLSLHSPTAPLSFTPIFLLPKHLIRWWGGEKRGVSPALHFQFRLLQRLFVFPWRPAERSWIPMGLRSS